MNGAQRAAGSAYANADQLTALATYLQGLTDLALRTGWHSPSMVVSFGDEDEEAIVVGLRWVSDAYHAEIR